jgi:class 3 adenylate cyclase
MTNSEFMKGMGMGIAAGAVMGTMMGRRRKLQMRKSAMGKAVRTAAQVMDEISNMMGM